MVVLVKVTLEKICFFAYGDVRDGACELIKWTLHLCQSSQTRD